MKTVTSATVFHDAVGLRISMTYSEIDESTGKVIADNKRLDRIVTDPTARTEAEAILAYAQTFIDAGE